MELLRATRLSALLLVAACGNGPSPTASTPPRSGEAARSEAESGGESTSTRGTGQPPTALTVTVEESSQLALAPDSPPPSYRAVSHRGEIHVLLTAFRYYCEPVPSFSAREEGATLVLQVNAPDGAVSRCMGIHNLELSLGTVNSNHAFTEVVLLDAEGTEAARIPVDRAR